MDAKEIIARRVAKELNDGDVVNLGIGLPGLVSNYVPEEYDITLQAENGLVGLGPAPEEGKEDKDITNAGAMFVTAKKGSAFFDSSMSFTIIRGGHVNTTVLGALEVDAEGSLANWKIPGKMVPGMGGAMDLVVGAKKVIVAMLHTQKGEHKIFEKCRLPLTAYKQVDLIVTELGVLEVTKDGLLLTELGPGATVEDVISATSAKIKVAENLKTYDI